MREETVEERVQLRVREPRLLPVVHARTATAPYQVPWSAERPDTIAARPAAAGVPRAVYAFCTVPWTRSCTRFVQSKSRAFTTRSAPRARCETRSPARCQPGSSFLLRHTDVNDPLNGAEYVLRGADRDRSRLCAGCVLSPAGDRAAQNAAPLTPTPPRATR
jgi:hypothetical protein